MTTTTVRSSRPDSSSPGAVASGISQPSVVLTGALAACATWALYHFLFYPAADTALGGFFANRGMAQPMIVLFGLWSFAILAVKFVSIARQRMAIRATRATLRLPDAIGPGAAAELLAAMSGLPRSIARSHLSLRTRAALGAFLLRRTPASAAEALREEAAADAQLVERSMSHVRLLGWALPLTGMIGTLFGLGQAVGSLAHAFASAVDLQALQAVMPTLTGGLGTAFDVTLLGLATCVLVMVPATWLHQLEEGLLAHVDAHCRQELLPRLRDDGDLAASKLQDAVVTGWRHVNEQMQLDLADRSQQWSAQQAGLASQVATDLAAAGQKSAAAMETAMVPMLAELRGLRAGFDGTLAATVTAMGTTAAEVTATMLRGLAETGQRIGTSLAGPIGTIISSLGTAMDKHVVALGRLESDVRSPVAGAILSLDALATTLSTELPALLTEHRATAEDCLATANQMLALNKSFTANALKLNQAGKWLTDVRGLDGNIRQLEQVVEQVADGLARQHKLPRRRVG